MVPGLVCLYIWDLGVSFKTVMTSVTTLYNNFDEKKKKNKKIVRHTGLRNFIMSIYALWFEISKFWNLKTSENVNSHILLWKNQPFQASPYTFSAEILSAFRIRWGLREYGVGSVVKWKLLHGAPFKFTGRLKNSKILSMVKWLLKGPW